MLSTTSDGGRREWANLLRGDSGMENLEPSAAKTSERGQLLRAIVASTVGTTIEWYDFFLYNTAAALVFAKPFFPMEDPVVGTLSAFAIQFVGFAARPLGAFIFGHFGDRVGSKATLIVTLLTMGLASALIGLLPTYAQIGLLGAVLLTVLRLLQGSRSAASGAARWSSRWNGATAGAAAGSPACHSGACPPGSCP